MNGNLTRCLRCCILSPHKPHLLVRHCTRISTTADKGNDGEAEAFTGYIPIDQLEIKHTRSGGAGGQNANKVNSTVEMRFHVETAEWIPPWIRPRLLQQEKQRITKDGFYIINSERTRKQLLNQADCLDKIRNSIYKCSALPKVATAEQLALKEHRLKEMQQSILREKREKSLKKFSRQSPSPSEF